MSTKYVSLSVDTEEEEVWLKLEDKTSDTGNPEWDTPPALPD